MDSVTFLSPLLRDLSGDTADGSWAESGIKLDGPSTFVASSPRELRFSGRGVSCARVSGVLGLRLVQNRSDLDQP